jgi:hypothetical protein
VSRLLNENADINKRCIDFKSTPLFWAINGYQASAGSRHHQVECARLLINAGADKTVANAEGKTLFDMLASDDREMIAILA